MAVEYLLILLKVCSFQGISFWAGILWRRTNRYGAFSSVLVMAGSAIYTDYVLGWTLAEQTALYFLPGVLTLIIVSLLTKPEPETQLTQVHL